MLSWSDLTCAPHAQVTSWTSRCFGPFEISQKISDSAYRLRLPASWKIHDVLHVSHLIPERKDTILGRRQEPPPPVEIEGEVEYEVERILKERKTRGGVTHYLVRWVGYGEEEDCWVPEYNMGNADEAIASFKAHAPPAHKRGRKR